MYEREGGESVSVCVRERGGREGERERGREGGKVVTEGIN